MIKLVDKPNTESASVDYPFGSVRDKTPTLAGTRYDKNFMSDMTQFFEKLFNESGLSSNGLLDNETNGFQLYDALKKVVRPFKVLTMIMSQSGTNAPEFTILENQLGGSAVASRSNEGIYIVNFGSDIFGTDPNNRCSIFSPGSGSAEIKTINVALSDDSFQVFQKDSSSDFIDEFTNIVIEIRVYD